MTVDSSPSEINLYFNKMGQLEALECVLDKSVYSRFFVQKDEAGTFKEIKAVKGSAEHQTSFEKFEEATLIWNSALLTDLPYLSFRETTLKEFPKRVTQEMLVLGNQMYSGALNIAKVKIDSSEVKRGWNLFYQNELRRLFNDKTYTTEELLSEGMKEIKKS